MWGGNSNHPSSPLQGDGQTAVPAAGVSGSRPLPVPNQAVASPVYQKVIHDNIRAAAAANKKNRSPRRRASATAGTAPIASMRASTTAPPVPALLESPAAAPGEVSTTLVAARSGDAGTVAGMPMVQSEYRVPGGTRGYHEGNECKVPVPAAAPPTQTHFPAPVPAGVAAAEAAVAVNNMATSPEHRQHGSSVRPLFPPTSPIITQTPQQQSSSQSRSQKTTPQLRPAQAGLSPTPPSPIRAQQQALYSLCASNSWELVAAHLRANPTNVHIIHPTTGAAFSVLHFALASNTSPSHKSTLLSSVQTVLSAAPHLANITDQSGNLPLNAILRPRYDVSPDVKATIVDALIKSSPTTLQAQDSEGRTALHNAVRNGCPLSIVRLVLEPYPVATTVRDRSGLLPIHHLCRLPGAKVSTEPIFRDLIESQLKCIASQQHSPSTASSASPSAGAATRAIEVEKADRASQAWEALLASVSNLPVDIQGGTFNDLKGYLGRKVREAHRRIKELDALGSEGNEEEPISKKELAEAVAMANSKWEVSRSEPPQQPDGGPHALVVVPGKTLMPQGNGPSSGGGGNRVGAQAGSSGACASASSSSTSDPMSTIKSFLPPAPCHAQVKEGAKRQIPDAHAKENTAVRSEAAKALEPMAATQQQRKLEELQREFDALKKAASVQVSVLSTKGINVPSLLHNLQRGHTAEVDEMRNKVKELDENRLLTETIKEMMETQKSQEKALKAERESALRRKAEELRWKVEESKRAHEESVAMALELHNQEIEGIRKNTVERVAEMEQSLEERLGTCLRAEEETPQSVEDALTEKSIIAQKEKQRLLDEHNAISERNRLSYEREMNELYTELEQVRSASECSSHTGRRPNGESATKKSKRWTIHSDSDLEEDDPAFELLMLLRDEISYRESVVDHLLRRKYARAGRSKEDEFVDVVHHSEECASRVVEDLDDVNNEFGIYERFPAVVEKHTAKGVSKEKRQERENVREEDRIERTSARQGEEGGYLSDFSV